MARAGVWWLAAAILVAASAVGCRIFRSCEPTRGPECIGTEMSIVWTGAMCTWVHSAGNENPCWESIAECNAEHASCPDMMSFRCGDEWCYKTNQVCGVFADGRRRCVASPTVPPSCDGTGSIATRCTKAHGGIEVKIARELPCGSPGWHCSAGFERCEIAPEGVAPGATCVANTAQSLKECRDRFAWCRLLGEDYRVRGRAEDLGTTFPCGGSLTCLRHQEVCVMPAARPNDFTKPGRCVREEFPDCLARGFDHCRTDTFGAQYAFR